MATTFSRRNNFCKFLTLLIEKNTESRQVSKLHYMKRHLFSFEYNKNELSRPTSNSQLCRCCGKENAAVVFSVELGPFCHQLSVLSPGRCFQTSLTFIRNMAGHSHWANIKFKKMHKDVEKSKVFGKLSLEIITAVRENGADPANNSKLDEIISRAKAAKMPKDSIESAIKSALRAGSESRTSMLLEVRGPGRCGILVDILSPNIARCRAEIKSLLKKHGGVLCDGGSVSFMFKHKGVVTIEGSTDDSITENKVEEAAILSGAESFHFDSDEDEKPVIRFICEPLEVKSVAEALTSEHDLKTTTATQEYVATDLNELNEVKMTQADKLIDHLSGHPDVMRVFDNIMHYPSSTFKLNDT